MGDNKLLIVDDQFGIRILLYEIFNKEGYMTFQAANGLQALDIVKMEKPQVVILDMKIPGMDGVEILRRIREIDPGVRAFIMTAYGELEMIEEAKRLGVIHFFAKPFDIDDIRRRVREQFEELHQTIK